MSARRSVEPFGTAPSTPSRWALALHLLVVALALLSIAVHALEARRNGLSMPWRDTLIAFGLVPLSIAGWLGPTRRPAHRLLLALGGLFVVGHFVLRFLAP